MNKILTKKKAKSRGIKKDSGFNSELPKKKVNLVSPLSVFAGFRCLDSWKPESFFSCSKEIQDKCATLDDNQLIKLIITSNREAYHELFRRYEKKLFVYIYHMVSNREETEDILQNVFTKTYRSIEKFDVNRKFSSWIYRIAHNETINYLKRKNKKQFISFEDVSTSKDKLEASFSEDFIEDVWMRREENEEIDAALEKLPLKYKEVLKMRYFSEYSYEKISAILHKPVNTVGTLINRAKKKLVAAVAEVQRAPSRKKVKK